MIGRRLAAIFIVFACLLSAPPARTQPYPARPITIVIPFPAGGSADTLARLIGQQLNERLGQAVVVENKPGAGGNLGTDMVAKAAPDGYTLLLAPSSIAIAPSLYTKLPFDPIKDFAPVTLIGSIPMVVVVYPEFPAKTIPELIALAKSKPGEITYASAGNGSTNHLAVELFKIKTGIDMLHVPYRGNPLAIMDVIAGRVPVFFDFVLTGLPHVREGKVRALATTGAHRSKVLPDVPTVMEAGVPDFEASTWFGLYAPAGTKPTIVEKLNAEILAVLAMPNIRERLTSLGVDIIAEGPQTLAALTKSDLEKWGPIVQKAGVPDFEASTWFALYAPAGTKPAIVEKLNAEILAVLAMPNIRERLTSLGVDIIAEGPQALAALTKSDLEKWGPIVQKAGVKLD